MNPISTTDNDLQKAIDDITNNDSIFDEPVATPTPELTPEPIAPIPTPPEILETPEPASFQNSNFNPPIAPAPNITVPPIPEPETLVKETETVSVEAPASPEIHNIKEAVLRDLAPIVDKIDMDPTEKFGLYKNIRDELHDNSVIAPAYEVSKKITDDKARADALLYLYDSLK